MPAPVIAAGVSVAGNALLNGGGGNTQAAVPGDMQGLRHQQIQLLQYLLGFGGGPGQGPASTTRANTGGSTTLGGAPSSGFAPGGLNSASMGGAPSRTPGAPGSANPFANGFGDPTKRLESFFGPLTSPLQQQAVAGAGNYLSGGLPQQKALDFITGLLKTNPGQGALDALQPHFQQNLASANQSGARFSSGNEVLRSQAVNDYNLMAQQALQHGVDQQLQGAGMTDALSSGMLNNYAQASQLGDTETQRRLQLLLTLLQTAQGASFQLPLTQQSGSGLGNGLGAGLDFAAILKALGGNGITPAPAFPTDAATAPVNP